MLLIALGLVAAAAAMPYQPPSNSPVYEPSMAVPEPVVYLPPTFNNAVPANVRGGRHHPDFLDIFYGPRPFEYPFFGHQPPLPVFWMPPRPAPQYVPQQ
ncbi:hypothetical protein COOONC_25805, partial [Cooperia oncophora]